MRGKRLLLLCLFLAGVFFAACQPNAPVPTSTSRITTQLLQVADQSTHDVLVKRKTKDPVTLHVEVVHSVESVQQGLSDRESIGSDGMLFVFRQATPQSFWMPRMKFDIDIIWINNGEVIGVTANVPRPASIDSTDLPLYHSPGPADMVLELPSGRAEELELTAGDVLVMP